MWFRLYDTDRFVVDTIEADDLQDAFECLFEEPEGCNVDKHDDHRWIVTEGEWTWCIAEIPYSPVF